MASSSSSCSDISPLSKASYSNSNSPPARQLGHVQLIGCMIASMFDWVRGLRLHRFGRSELRRDPSLQRLLKFEQFQFGARSSQAVMLSL